MGLYERTGASSPMGDCVECGKPTRSHVIEPALYEDYDEEVVTSESDEYANKQWETTNVVTKYELAEYPVVMCHSCWGTGRERSIGNLNQCYDDWINGVGGHLMGIRNFLRDWKEHDYGKGDRHKDASQRVEELQKAIRRFARE